MFICRFFWEAPPCRWNWSPIHSKRLTQHCSINGHIVGRFNPLVNPLICVYHSWLVVSTPLKNMKVSWDDYAQYMKNKKFPNHQPDSIYVYVYYQFSYITLYYHRLINDQSTKEVSTQVRVQDIPRNAGFTSNGNFNGEMMINHGLLLRIVLGTFHPQERIWLTVSPTFCRLPLFCFQWKFACWGIHHIWTKPNQEILLTESGISLSNLPNLLRVLGLSAMYTTHILVA